MNTRQKLRKSPDARIFISLWNDCEREKKKVITSNISWAWHINTERCIESYGKRNRNRERKRNQNTNQLCGINSRNWIYVLLFVLQLQFGFALLDSSWFFLYFVYLQKYTLFPLKFLFYFNYHKIHFLWKKKT